jgi:tryptophanyl-tRNA synthetase
LRQSVGLRNLSQLAESSKPSITKNVVASFKQYREKDGLFYFKMVNAQGTVMLQSLGFESPKVAGQHIAQLREGGATALAAMQHLLTPLDAEEAALVIAALAELAA